MNCIFECVRGQVNPEGVVVGSELPAELPATSFKGGLDNVALDIEGMVGYWPPERGLEVEGISGSRKENVGTCYPSGQSEVDSRWLSLGSSVPDVLPRLCWVGINGLQYMEGEGRSGIEIKGSI